MPEQREALSGPEVPLETLRAIDGAVLKRLQQLSPQQVEELLQMQDYHGFQKSRLPTEFLESILQPFGLAADQVQIEVVSVHQDLTKEVHYHRDATAHIHILGQSESLPEPKKAQVFLGDRWLAIQAGDTVPIPEGTAHGFTVENDGQLFFLSVQAPPIERSDGADDYIG